MEHILILVNHNSGYKSKNLIIENLRLSLKNKSYLVKDCYNKKDAESYLKNYNDFSFIILIGGDGTLSHTINYLKSIKKDIKPIGLIPAGSGNGLMKSLLSEKNMNYNMNNIVNSVLQFKEKKIDIMEVELLEEKKNIDSFLFISCGLFSDIDVGTDYLRCIGNYRFIIGGILSILFQNSFYATLNYNDELNNSFTISGDFIFFMANNAPYTSDDTFTSPKSKTDDGLIKIAYLGEPYNRYTLTKVLLGLSDGSFINHLTYISVKSFKLIPDSGVIDIDGEKFNTQPINVKIKEKKLSILI
jgi:sphingosine kinase